MSGRKTADVNFEDQFLRLRDENIRLKQEKNNLADDRERLKAQVRIKDSVIKKDGSLQDINATNVIAMAEEVKYLRETNGHLKDRLRRVEVDVSNKALARGLVVDYGRAPRPAKKPIALGIQTPSQVSARIRRGSRSGSRGRSSENKSMSPGSNRFDMGMGTPMSAGRSTVISSAAHFGGAESGRPSTAPATAGDASLLSSRLAQFESQIGGLQKENESLRLQLAESNARSGINGGASGGPGQGMTTSMLAVSSAGHLSTAATTASHGYSHASSATVPVPRADLLELERQLKDKTAQVLLLKSRYEHLESKSLAERELYDRAVAALEEQNAQIRDARASLQAAEADVNLLRSRLRGQDDAEQELRSARDEVKRLERTLTELCESPFIANGKERIDTAEKVEKLQKKCSELQEQVVYLQGSVKSQHHEILKLRDDKKTYAESNDKLKEELSQLRLSADTATRANSTLRERLALYSGIVAMEGTASASAAGAASSGSGNGNNALSLYNGGAGSSNAVPPEELERALTLVRKRMDNPGALDGGASSSSSSADGEANAPLLRKKVQSLQLALLSNQREVERLEAMLRAQTSIAKDLQAEVTDLNEMRSTETNSLRERLAATQQLADQRKQYSDRLEVQIKDLVRKIKELQAASSQDKKERKERRDAEKAAAASALATIAPASTLASGPASAASRRQSSGIGMPLSSARDGADNDEDDDASTVISALSGDDEAVAAQAQARNKRAPGANDDNTLDSSLGNESSLNIDFGPGENAIEIYIVDATIDPAALGRHDTTFALIDFLDFDSQTSPLASGPAPSYNFSASYRVATDHFFLRNIATQGATIDIMRAVGSEFEMLARCALPLHRLLQPDQQKVKFSSLSLVDKRSGKVVGSVKVEVRAAVPLGELWSQFQRDKPAEGANLAAFIRDKEAGNSIDTVDGGGAGAALASTNMGSAAASLPGSGTANELVVTVVGASGLPRASTTSASGVFVQYGIPLPGMQVAMTPVVSSASSSPVIADSRSFPLVPTQRLLSALGASPIQFAVVQDASAANASSSMRSIGRGSMASPSASNVPIGIATVSLVAVSDGGAIDASYDIIDTRGASAGKLHVKIGWARPLTAIDGAPADSLARSQVHALASIFDRDGAGVKHELLYMAVTMPENDARALDRVRESIGVHERMVIGAASASSSAAGTGLARTGSFSAGGSRTGGGAGSMCWDSALRNAAEAVGRPGSGLTPREVFEALTSPSVNVSIDLITIEDAILGLLPRDVHELPAEDVIDVFTPLSASAASALSKVRRFVATLNKKAKDAEAASAGSGKNVPRLDYCLEDEAEDAARRVYGQASKPTKEQMARVSRAGVANALKQCGMVILEDGMMLASSSSSMSSLVRDPRSQPDFNADPNRQIDGVADALAATAPIASSSAAAQQQASSSSAGRPDELKPTLVTESVAIATQKQAAAARRPSGAAAASTAAMSSVDTAARRPSGTTKEVVFDSTMPATVVAEQAAAAVPAPASTAAVSVASDGAQVDSYPGLASDAATAALSVEISSLTRLHPALAALINKSSIAPSGSTNACLYLAYSVPSASSCGASGVTGVHAVLAGAMSADGKSITFTPYARAYGSGSRFGTTTTFPLTSGSALATAMAKALSSTAAPEDSDIVFAITSAPPSSSSTGVNIVPSSILCTATYSLLDLVADGKDASSVDLPCLASDALPAATAAESSTSNSDASVTSGSIRPGSTTVADLTVTITGWKALRELAGSRQQ